MTKDSNTRPAVLFVCLGNICRSPMAEGAMRAAAANAGLDIMIDSAGTAGYHIGSPPDSRAIATAKRHGIDISQLRGRQLADEDFHTFTHIFALDRANMATIKARAPHDGAAKLAFLRDALAGDAVQDVADPYYGDDAGFEDCWQIVSSATEALTARFVRDGTRAVF